MLPKHVRYQAALHPARPGCRHRRWFCSRRRNISYYTCVHLSTPFFNFSEKTSLPFLLPSQRSLAPLCKGSCAGVSHGLFMISHHRPCGRWCSARLIRQAETLELQLHSQPPSKRTALSELKRSCFRFAPLTLRCRTVMTLRDIPVFRSAYSASRNARAPAASRPPVGGGSYRSPLPPPLPPP